MLRKALLLAPVLCYGFGVWSGMLLQRGAAPTDGLATRAAAAEPKSDRHPHSSTGATSTMSVVQALADSSGKSPSPAKDTKLRIICFGTPRRLRDQSGGHGSACGPRPGIT